ncbi:hypothetical protein [Kitasatospora aureofaciens]|uniref:hypothetical protein n=1 Tax=Kitasatospora aureofaciens TaxID=1894 RepID=UPI001C47D355|nr:hypothetical protein [Kitasatospora aureofaciens]MBV6696893.1 hypothetical protein [Kitasatospora aureofaciens]
MASTAQQTGGAVGLAVLVAITAPGKGDPVSTAVAVDGLRPAMLAASAGIAITSLVALRFPRRRSAPVAAAAESEHPALVCPREHRSPETARSVPASTVG